MSFIQLKQQNFKRYAKSMIIRKGVRLDNQDDQVRNPQQYGSTGFNADRSRTNFQKDVDSLLFGDTRPPPRRGRQDPKPVDPKPTEPQKKPIVEQKKTTTLQQKKTLPNTEVKKTDPPVNNQLFQKVIIEKPKTQVKKTQPPKKDNYVSQQPPKIIKTKQTIQQQPKNSKQSDSLQTPVNIDNLTFYNRPGYIRKLKKIAEDFKFAEQNLQRHRFIQVLRPSQCVRGLVRKLNSPNYQDSEFPPNWTSIGKQYRSDGVEWKKPQEVFKSSVFGKYVDPNDIQPGTMSSPQFLSTLSCLAERQENIKRLIQNQKVNSNGFYFVRINVNGVWRYVAVDHNLPQNNGRALGARSYADSQSQLWVSLVQKAYAKVYNGYSCFKNALVPRQHYLRDLTGAPVKKYEISNPNLIQIINQSLQLGFPIVAVPTQKITQLGFNPNYSLSVLKSSGKGVQVRSSWGTIVQRPKVNISRQGVFQLNFTQLKDYVSYIMVAETQPNISSTTIQSKHHQSFYSCYSFKLNNHNANGTISISQWDRRLFSQNVQYDYAPFRLILQKKNVDDQENNSIYVNAAFSHHSRNLDLPVNLSPGVYYLYCIGSWSNQNYDYDLTIYANQLVQITKIYHSSFPNIIAEALTQECLSNGKRAAKGNVDEYILYHEPSNLVLITALSLIDKPYNFTLNLQQVKPETLSLLNVVRPQDTFAKKQRESIKQYKETVFNQKTWEVNLLPHEKYTWVFSSTQDYDNANFKNWGFR